MTCTGMRDGDAGSGLLGSVQQEARPACGGGGGMSCCVLPNTEVSAACRAVLMEKPDIVVGTPSRILNHLQQDSLVLRDSLELLVLDEADLLFSFGFEEELKGLLW